MLKTESGSDTYPLRVSFVNQRLDGTIISQQSGSRPFVAGSIAKLWIAAASVAIIEQGDRDWEEPVRIIADEFFQGGYGTGLIPDGLQRKFLLPALLSRRTGWNLIPTLPLSDVIRRTIKDSDNLAVLKLANLFGRERIQAQLYQWGLYDISILNPETGSPNQTTASNAVLFLRLLDNGDLISQERVDQFQSWMRKKKFTNREGLENELVFYNGQVEEEGFTYCHRVGFVFGQETKNAFAVLTKDKPIKKDTEVTYRQVKEVEETVAGISWQIV